MRYSEELAYVPGSEPDLLVEVLSGSCRGGDRRLGSGCCLLTRPVARLNSGAHRTGKPLLLDQLHAARGIDKESDGLANVAACLRQASTIRVAPSDLRHSYQPVPVGVDLENNPMLAHLSHFLPRHGCRSRSIARSVPMGRSRPAWIGIVVVLVPHRHVTRTCDPFCRTTLPPSFLSLRRACFPVTV